ncbi:MAG: DUF86 domain-containing protein [Bacteroides sp.]|nr:DUF86 domain-containing protein [Bacteroides sp.]
MREKPRDSGRLKHILLAINNIERFLKEFDASEYVENSALYFAIVKNLEIIGEASYMLTPEFKQSHPQTPWKQIIGMRHYLVHGYYHISLDETWNSIHNDLPPLKMQIESYLKEIDSSR